MAMCNSLQTRAGTVGVIIHALHPSKYVTWINKHGSWAILVHSVRGIKMTCLFTADKTTKVLPSLFHQCSVPGCCIIVVYCKHPHTSHKIVIPDATLAFPTTHPITYILGCMINFTNGISLVFYCQGGIRQVTIKRDFAIY